ncbi:MULTISPECIES: hypothetical protein [unclassified Phenylobacterium]|uniref:hypothetical protein n=1 Tax=unclassified Phenylobacterium TaxID=2640670 RepID=UPI00083B9688|nr:MULTISPECIES: hypothetical protein [unclassified Phenylobacterium]
MLIASQFLLWVVAALLFIAVLALSRQVSGLRERLESSPVCTRCGQPHEAAADTAAQSRPREPTSFA